MKRIHKLESNISNKIAAGEVVERPAAVVKELVENAIDAGAQKISIEIQKAGKALIRVTDDGAGIDPDDVELAFERHATSKIDTVEDIYRVATLGFRGEALASICAVSNMDVITRRSDQETGVKLTMSGGRQLSKEVTGCPTGTTMVVRDLFFNTPARLKFLKSDNAEITAISDIVNKLALSHCEVGFKYVVNDKTLFSTPGRGDLFKAVYSIYEKEMSRNLIEIDKKENGMAIKGYMTNLQYTRGNRSMMNFFVNGRYIKSPVLMDGLAMAYQSMLTPGRFPACFIMIELDPGKVDVNIHPAKTEIKFHQEGIVKQVLYTAARETLLSYNQTPVVELSSDDVFRRVVMEEVPIESPVKVSEPDRSSPDIRSHPVYGQSRAAVHRPADESSASSGQNPSSVQGQKAVQRPEAVKIPNAEKTSRLGQDPSPEQNQNSEQNPKADQRLNFEKTPKTDQAPQADLSTKVIQRPASDMPVLEKTAVSRPAHRAEDNTSLTESHQFSYEDMGILKTQDPFIRESDKPAESLSEIAVTQDSIKHKAEIYQGLQYVGQLFMTYLLFEKDGKMYLIDQHAAHEKILYERLLRQYRRFEMDRQILLDPILIELSYDMHHAVMAAEAAFEKLGLSIADFGGNSIVIREIPALLDRSGAEALFHRAHTGLIDGEHPEQGPAAEKLESIMQESCKTAVKAHDHLDNMEVETLLDQLAGLEDPYTCPHGRPIIISITQSEIEKKFKRT